MDFKEYYHKKINEELEREFEHGHSSAEMSYETSHDDSYNSKTGKKPSANGKELLTQAFFSYLFTNNIDTKEAFKSLGKDLGDIIWNFIISDKYIPTDAFKEGGKNKYLNFVDNKFNKGAKETLFDLLRQTGCDISNAKNDNTL